MADLRIEQLPSALTLALADLVPLAAYDEQVATGYKANKITAAEIAAALLTTFEQSGLNTTSKTIVGAINEIVTSLSSAPEVLTGTGDPSSAQGSDKDFYVKYATSGGVTSVTGLFVKLSGDWVSIATGGGNTDIFVITASDSVTIDKTEQEILAAIAAKKPIILIDNTMTNTPTVYTYYNKTGLSSDYKLYFGSAQNKRNNVATLEMYNSHPLLTFDVYSYNTPYDMTATLTAGQTTVTFTNSLIGTSGATYDFYTDVLGVNPTAASISGTTLTLTFEAQASDISVKVRITT